MIEVHQLKIDPELASRILERNTRNRHVRERTVTAFARDMREGRWNEDNGETIKVSWMARGGSLDPNTDVLIDGQHRLWAIIQADVPINLLVAFGVSPDAQDTIDTGMKRTYADTLHLRGEHDSNTLAAIVKRVYVWEMNGDETPGHKNPHVTHPQLDETLERHPELRKIRETTTRIYGQGQLVPKSSIGLLIWAFAQLEDVDDEDVQYFFERLADGQNLVEGDPIYTLRKKLIELRQSPNRPNDRMVMAFVIKAWNAYRAGEQLKVLRFKPGGANPDRFPTPR